MIIIQTRNSNLCLFKIPKHEKDIINHCFQFHIKNIKIIKNL